MLPSCVTSDPWRQIWAAISLWGRPLAEKIGIFWPVEEKDWWNYWIFLWTWSFFKSKILTSGDWIHHINGTNSGLNHFFWVDSGIGVNGLTLNGKKFLDSISVLKVGKFQEQSLLPSISILPKTACGLKFYWYLRTLSLKFLKARTKIEVLLSLPSWLAQFSLTTILLVAFWNFKLKILKYPKNCRLHAILVLRVLKKSWISNIYRCIILYLPGCPENLRPLLWVLYLWVFRIRWKFDPTCLLKRAFARCRR